MQREYRIFAAVMTSLGVCGWLYFLYLIAR